MLFALLSYFSFVSKFCSSGSHKKGKCKCFQLARVATVKVNKRDVFFSPFSMGVRNALKLICRQLVAFILPKTKPQFRNVEELLLYNLPFSKKSENVVIFHLETFL